MALALLATLLGACVQSATGFGFVLLLGPAILTVVDPVEAVTTMLALTVALNLLMLFGERRRRQIRRPDLLRLLAAAAPGMVLGVAILSALSKPALQILVGVAVLVAAALQVRLLRRRSRSPSPPAPALEGSPASALAAGLTAGTLTTTTGTNGPPMVLWLQARGATPAELRDTLAAAFLALSLGGSLLLAVAAGSEHELDPAILLPLLGCVVAGQLLGRSIFERVDTVRFRQAGLTLVVAAGLFSLAAGTIEATGSEPAAAADQAR